MADYYSMYKKLFNAVTDTIRILQTAQVETEQMYILQEETKILLLKPDSGSVNLFVFGGKNGEGKSVI